MPSVSQASGTGVQEQGSQGGEVGGGEMVQGLVQMWTFALREAGTPGTLAPLASA